VVTSQRRYCSAPPPSFVKKSFSGTPTFGFSFRAEIYNVPADVEVVVYQYVSIIAAMRTGRKKRLDACKGKDVPVTGHGGP
jgi:hypothetical protein